jgi:hypothetical protein
VEVPENLMKSPFKVAVFGLRAWGCGCGGAKENEINTARRLLKIGFAPADLLYSESLTKRYQKLGGSNFCDIYIWGLRILLNNPVV